MARQFGRGLALAGVQVISGMARGIDGIAQGAAIEAGGKSFGIMGCGVDICYPPENKVIYDALLRNGGAISEYPPGMEPQARFFPMRNRIISALSDVLLVVEARQKSGTSITVDTALEQGREVLAVPGRVTDRLSDGCNYLISQGAGVAISVEDVLDRLWSIKGEAKPALSTEPVLKNQEKDIDDEMEVNKELTLEEKILEIVDIIPVSTSYIAEELFKKGESLSMPALMTTLMDMTCCGKIAQNGAYYRRIA
jgi:DNA processing protein